MVILSGAFRDSGVKQIQFEGGITEIANQLFYGCDKLESIELPDTVTSIGNNAFGSCTKLERVFIPSSVVSIGYDAFNGCIKLGNIVLPDSITRDVYKRQFFSSINIGECKRRNRDSY